MHFGVREKPGCYDNLDNDNDNSRTHIPDEIFQALATAGPGRFPRAALIEAVEQRQGTG
ncbi:hypothetical protein [uncultured Thiodictyon sp.]|jgi:hypothetical protein|uniref:hypothetical protein n=1 Tax=uncultured Thiodictyon sp. TaxID=1846217 RepID=UPI0025CFDEDC|nr:hypothetical protein [uncultured Thiodictyon sp.]